MNTQDVKLGDLQTCKICGKQAKFGKDGSCPLCGCKPDEPSRGRISLKGRILLISLIVQIALLPIALPFLGTYKGLLAPLWWFLFFIPTFVYLVIVIRAFVDGTGMKATLQALKAWNGLVSFGLMAALVWNMTTTGSLWSGLATWLTVLWLAGGGCLALVWVLMKKGTKPVASLSAQTNDQICPKCMKRNVAAQTFCWGCGHQLREPDQPAPKTAPSLAPTAKESEEALRRDVSSKEAEARLAIALKHEGKARYQEALEAYDGIVRDFPGTKQATEARACADGLRARMATST
ncbi:MAG: hypothetical protein ACLPT4_04765 [Verrucomicrobiia bacterium]